MTAPKTDREKFEAWYEWCSFNSGDVKYACGEAFQAGIDAEKARVRDAWPSKQEMFVAAEKEEASVFSFKTGVRWLRDRIFGESAGEK